MMTKDQVKSVTIVYNRFMDNEDGGKWTVIDDNLEWVGWMTTEELITETSLKVLKHSEGEFRCITNHSLEVCFAPVILSAVEAILELYSETLQLHKNNRYILEYYLSMSEMGMIYSQPVLPSL
jgi:hypothetical protein